MGVCAHSCRKKQCSYKHAFAHFYKEAPEALSYLLSRDELDCVKVSLKVLTWNARWKHWYSPQASAEATVRQRYSLVLLPQRWYYFVAVWILSIQFWEVLRRNDTFLSVPNGMGSREIRTVLSHKDLPLIVIPWMSTGLSTCLAYRRCKFRIEQYRELQLDLQIPEQFFKSAESWLLQCKPDCCCAPRIRISIFGQQQLTALAALQGPGARGLVPLLCTDPSTHSRVQKLHGLEHLVPAQSHLCNNIGKVCVLLSMHSLNYYLATSKL